MTYTCCITRSVMHLFICMQCNFLHYTVSKWNSFLALYQPIYITCRYINRLHCLCYKYIHLYTLHIDIQMTYITRCINHRHCLCYLYTYIHCVLGIIDIRCLRYIYTYMHCVQKCIWYTLHTGYINDIHCYVMFVPILLHIGIYITYTAYVTWSRTHIRCIRGIEMTYIAAVCTYQYILHTYIYCI